MPKINADQAIKQVDRVVILIAAYLDENSAGRFYTIVISHCVYVISVQVIQVKYHLVLKHFLQIADIYQ